jgi:glyoxylase-like metal-dependent hydrolase (beta-lactamase superfamily II)
LEPSAVYVVETSSGLVLVDSGLKSGAVRLRSQMARLGLDWKKIRAILLTHVHGDHTGGADSLRLMAGAKVYIGSRDAAVMRDGAPREAFFSIFSMPNDDPHPTVVDVELKGDEVLDFGDARFRAIATPGHTPGSICYMMERGSFRALFAGDVISGLLGRVEVHSPERNPLGTYSAYLPPRYRGDAKDYLASLRKLRAMPVPDLLLPGHPRSDPSPQSPQLTEERWKAILDQGITELETLVAHYEADGASFLEDTPRKLLPDLYYLGKFQGVAVYGFIAKSRFFVVNAPGGAGLSSFLKSSLLQLGIGTVRPFAVLLTSCDHEVTAGLNDLVETFQARVVAPSAGLPVVRGECPPRTQVLSAEDLPREEWFTVTPLLLQGWGNSPAAYAMPWSGKTVLFSGRIPAVLDQARSKLFFLNLTQSQTETMDYLLSIRRIEGVHPSLWLPAVPTDTQNANIYASEWNDLIAKNYGAAATILRGFP